MHKRERTDNTINSLSNGRLRMSSMSLEAWKSFFEWGGVILLFLTGFLRSQNSVRRILALGRAGFGSGIFGKGSLYFAETHVIRCVWLRRTQQGYRRSRSHDSGFFFLRQ